MGDHDATAFTDEQVRNCIDAWECAHPNVAKYVKEKT